MLLLLLAPAASAAGGVFAGPIGADPPTSSGTQVSIAPGADRNVLVLSAEVTSGATDMALLWPMVGLDPDSVELIEPSWFARIEEFTRPRVEKLRCGELVEELHWGTPPGCSSSGYYRPPVTRGEDAADDLGLGGTWSNVGLYTEVLPASAVEAWLAERSLELPYEMRERFEIYVEADVPVLAIRPQTPVDAGAWLPPVRFSVPVGEVTLPVTLGADLAQTRHDLVVYGVALDEVGNVSITNFPDARTSDDCVLPAGVPADEWYGTSFDALDFEADLPTWVLEFAGTPTSCDPCTSEPLEAYEVRDFGLEAEPVDTRVSRLHLRWDPLRLDEDPVVTFAGNDEDVILRWYEHDPRLGFAYPTCGASAEQDGDAEQDGTCANIRLPEEAAGCSTGPARAGLLLAALALVAARRRGAPILAFLLLVATTARAEEAPTDPGPRTELHLGLAVLGTDRVVPARADQGAPWALNPFLGAEVRRSLHAFAKGPNIGVLGQVRGWSGDAVPGGAGAIGFTLIEPAVGVDLRHGTFREGSPCWRGRYGASLALPTLFHGVTAPQTAPGVLLHGGFGAWVGRGLRRASIELRGSVLPRTDAYQTLFTPEVGLRGWMFFPGTANLWIVAGFALY